MSRWMDKCMEGHMDGYIHIYILYTLCYMTLCNISRKNRSVEIVSRLVVSWGLG